MKDIIKVAAVQMDPLILDKRANLNKVLGNTRSAAAKGAELIIFPECALTGYVFASRSEALDYAETVPGPAEKELAACCRQTGAYIVVGLLEKEGPKIFNSVILTGPGGLIGKHRKVHMPYVGVDRFIDPGDLPLRVYATPVGNIGMHICYDCNFPETPRILALLGADILALPTNWPDERAFVPEHVVPVRAMENKVHVVAVDRVGKERGTTFLGHSKIVNARGQTLVEASPDKEEVIYAELSLSEARQKRTVIKPGELEIDTIGDRRPEFYGEITRSNSKVKSQNLK